MKLVQSCGTSGADSTLQLLLHNPLYSTLFPALKSLLMVQSSSWYSMVHVPLPPSQLTIDPSIIILTLTRGSYRAQSSHLPLPVQPVQVFTVVCSGSRTMCTPFVSRLSNVRPIILFAFRIFRRKKLCKHHQVVMPDIHLPPRVTSSKQSFMQNGQLGSDLVRWPGL